MAIAWPVNVNNVILADGYNRAAQPNVLVTTQENGMRKMRRRFTARSVYHNVTLSFERVALADGISTEFQVFEAYVRDTLLDGVLEFAFPIPDILGTPDTYLIRTCRFSMENNSVPYRIQKYFGTRVYVMAVIEEVPQ